MADFESGVSSYVMAEATVTVAFPVDHRGNADISCYQCYYFRRNYQTCGLNGEICQYPNRYVGSLCPLKLKNENKTEENTNESN
jgi:hypothetical protein